MNITRQLNNVNYFSSLLHDATKYLPIPAATNVQETSKSR